MRYKFKSSNRHMQSRKRAIVKAFLKSKPVLRFRYRAEFIAVSFLAWFIPRLARGSVLTLSRWFGNLAMHLDSRGRRLGLRNIEFAVRYGKLDLFGKSSTEILLACYQNFARGLFDLFWFRSISVETVNQWVQFEGEEYHLDELKTSTGGVFVTPHYGIFEWTSLAVGYHGLKLNIVAQDFSNPLLTRLFKKAREYSGHRVLSRDGAMLKILRAVRGGQNVAILPDLNIRHQGISTSIRMFGAPACLTSVHTEVARRCGVPIILAVCEPLPDGRAKLKIIDVLRIPHDLDAKGVNQVTQLIWDRFEEAIRRKPELWLWMYTHWRYQSDSINAGLNVAYEGKSDRLTSAFESNNPDSKLEDRLKSKKLSRAA
jgi:KDO2-lipid IV(A) lauroyltransferase